MTKLSLDEPPSKFIGSKKEVSKKENENISRLIVSSIVGKSKNKNISSSKGQLEKKVASEKQKNTLDTDYLKNGEASYEENLTLTNSSAIEFTSSDKMIINTYCIQGEKNANFSIERKEFSIFYRMDSPYLFIPKIREEEKREDFPPQSNIGKEQENTYAIYNFTCEEPTSEK